MDRGRRPGAGAEADQDLEARVDPVDRTGLRPEYDRAAGGDQRHRDQLGRRVQAGHLVDDELAGRDEDQAVEGDVGGQGVVRVGEVEQAQPGGQAHQQER